MEPYKALILPCDYKIDKEMLILIAEANERYGVYKSLLHTLEFDSTFFLDSVLLSDSYKSTQIEGTQITQDEMYYLKYMKKTDDNLEITNLKQTIEYGYQRLKKDSKITLPMVNEMHKILLNSVRGAEKAPGIIRDTQNWIGPSGVGIEGATFVPPAPGEVVKLLLNLYDYMNDCFIDPLFVNLAISHAQFETIHAYKDGNGRLGRALIPIQMSLLDDERPILFMSEVLEVYKPSYQRFLMESRRGNVAGFIKFFLQCVIDQCCSNIYKLKKIKEIYAEDMKTIEKIKGKSIYKIMPVIMRHVVFTKKEVEVDSGVSTNVVSKIVNQLVNLGVLERDSTVIKKGYRYQRIYEVFVGNKDYR